MPRNRTIHVTISPYTVEVIAPFNRRFVEESRRIPGRVFVKNTKSYHFDPAALAGVMEILSDCYQDPRPSVRCQDHREAPIHVTLDTWKTDMAAMLSRIAEPAPLAEPMGAPVWEGEPAKLADGTWGVRIRADQRLAGAPAMPAAGEVVKVWSRRGKVWNARIDCIQLEESNLNVESGWWTVSTR